MIVKPAEPVSIYASYSLTYQPRAGEQLSSLSLTNQSLDPEKFTNYEVGAKWDARPGVSLTGAVYRLNRNNVVVPDPTDASRSILVDGQRTKGDRNRPGGTHHPRLDHDRRVCLSGWGDHEHALSERQGGRDARAGAGSHVLALEPLRRDAPLGCGPRHHPQRPDVHVHRQRRRAARRSRGSMPRCSSTSRARSRRKLNLENLFDEGYYAFAHSNNNITPGSPRALRVSLTTRF